MTIDSATALADRMQIDRTQLAIASSQPGGVSEFLRNWIRVKHGEMTVLGKGPDGRLERAYEAWSRIFAQPFDAKVRKVVSKSVYKRNYRGAK